MSKCNWNGFIIKPDGVNELDPCVNRDIEVHKNVTVIVYKCKNCGKVDFEWKKQDNTESTIISESNQT